MLVWQIANTPRYQNKRLRPTVTWSSLIKLRNTQTHRLLYKWWWQTCNLLRSSETNVTGALVFKYVSISYTSTMHQQTHIQDGNTTHNHELNLFTTKERLILGDVKRVRYFTFTLEMELILVSRKSAHRATLSNGSRLTILWWTLVSFFYDIWVPSGIVPPFHDCHTSSSTSEEIPCSTNLPSPRELSHITSQWCTDLSRSSQPL